VARHISVFEEITYEQFSRFDTELQAFEAESHEPVYITLSSGGGSAMAGLAFHARMLASPCDLIVTAMGEAGSAASIILASGDKRRIHSSAWVLVHEDTGSLEGTVTEMEKQLRHMRRLEQQWAAIMGGLTKTTAAHWEAIQATSKTLNAKECLKLGLVDEVVK
jgi:ATP-dependent Clp protease protease subunit